jgi:hypothetical protein
MNEGGQQAFSIVQAWEFVAAFAPAGFAKQPPAPNVVLAFAPLVFTGLGVHEDPDDDRLV